MRARVLLVLLFLSFFCLGRAEGSSCPALDALIQEFVGALGLPIDPAGDVTISEFDTVDLANRDALIDSLVEYGRFLVADTTVLPFGIRPWSDLTSLERDSLDFSLILGVPGTVHDYLESIVAPGDRLLRVNWAPSSVPSFSSLALLQPDMQEVKYESFMFWPAIPDTTVVADSSLSGAFVPGKTRDSNDASWTGHVHGANVFDNTVTAFEYRVTMHCSVVPDVLSLNEWARFEERIDVNVALRGITLGKRGGVAIGRPSVSKHHLPSCGPFDTVVDQGEYCCAPFAGDTEHSWSLEVNDNIENVNTTGTIDLGYFKYEYTQSVSGAPFVSILYDSPCKIRLRNAMRNDGHGVFADNGAYIHLIGWIKAGSSVGPMTIWMRVRIHVTWFGWGVADDFGVQTMVDGEVSEDILLTCHYRCIGATQSESATWGRIKTLFR